MGTTTQGDSRDDTHTFVRVSGQSVPFPPPPLACLAPDGGGRDASGRHARATGGGTGATASGGHRAS